MSQSDDLRAALASVPFEKLLALQRKEEAKRAADTRRRPAASASAADSSASGDDSDGSADGSAPSSSSARRPQKRARGGPEELPSNRPVGRLRQVVHAERGRPVRDPRFDELSGRLREGGFRQAYAFLDGVRSADQDAIRRAARSAKKRGDEEALETASRALQAARDVESHERKRRVEQQKKKEVREMNAQRVEKGLAPVWVKRKEQRVEGLKKRYDEIKKRSGKAGIQRAIEGRLRRSTASQRRKLYGHYSRTAVPQCTVTLGFSDGTRGSAQPSVFNITHGPSTRWRLEFSADLSARFDRGPADRNVTVTVACADPEDGAGATSRWAFALGSCGDSGPAECVRSSAAGGACVYCGARCVRRPGSPRDVAAPNCSVCGDGVLSPGELCERSASAHCTALCTCASGYYETRSGGCLAQARHKRRGFLTRRCDAGIAVFEVQTEEPLRYPAVQRAAAAIAGACMPAVLAGAACNVSGVAVAQRSPLPRFWLRVAALPSPAPNASSPAELLAGVSGACVNRTAAAEGLPPVRWSWVPADARCGDGHVTPGEQCDASAYCDPLACRCAGGSRGVLGRCVLDALYAVFELRGPPVADDVARAAAGRVAALCLDLGEVALANATASASRAAVRVAVVPAGRPLPGARTPRVAVAATWARGDRCMQRALESSGLVLEDADASLLMGGDPEGLPGFERAPSSSSSSPSARGPLAPASVAGAGGRAAAALGPLALVALAAAL
eukprot:m51a1_g1001 hypothetical protein (734) ;mRNA; r:575463-578949